jgi:hypothetical protein
MPKEIKKKSSSVISRKKIKPSQLSDFVENDLPSEEEVTRFDEYLRGSNNTKVVEDSLSKIYEGDNGKRINVQEVNIKRRRSIWSKLGFALLYFTIIIGLIAGAYYFLIFKKNSASPLLLSLSSDQAIVANQEFIYTLEYQNQDNIPLTHVEATVVFPDNFILTDNFPTASVGNNKWSLPDIQGFSSGQIKIRGRLLGKSGEANILFADMSYQPEGVSVTFKKTSSLSVVLVASGFDMSSDNPGSILVGEEKTVTVTWVAQEQNYIDNFTIRALTSDNVVISSTKEKITGITSDQIGVWQIDPSNTTEPLSFKFKVLEKKSASEEIKLVFEYTPANSSRSYVFEEKVLTVEVVKNNLNLLMTANGQTSDQGVDFEEVINYSISYANKGEGTMNDVIITAVLDGDALDWRKLEDENNGKVAGSTILWTSTEIPALKSLSTNQQGEINFSIPVRSHTEAKLFNRFEIKSYAQFALSEGVVEEEEEEVSENQGNRSNQLIIKINSDIDLDESVRYFNTDNIAVGTGPLPPKVGEVTTLKVYWTIKNTLHEVGDLVIRTTLPSGVTWNGKELASVGTISYDQLTNQVSWNIGRLPLSVSSVTGEFSISLQPRFSDQNKLMILASGTTLSGNDSQTSFPISKQLKAQTTKLEKDDIANTDGIVE